MLAGQLGLLVGDVEVDEVVARHLHLVVDGACHDVARRKAAPLVIFLHELFAALRAQHRAVAAHGLGYQEAGRLAGVVERRGVELHELHVLYHTLGAEDHGYAVARGDDWVGSDLIDVADAAGGHHGEFGQESDDLVGLLVHHIGAVAAYIVHPRLVGASQMVLGDNVDGKVLFVDVDVGMILDLRDERALNLEAGVVEMVQDAELGVTALAVQVEVAVGALVERRAPRQQLLYLRRSLGYHLLHHLGVADEGAGYVRVADVLLVVVRLIGDGRDAALCKRSVGDVERRFRNERHAALGGHLERERQAGRSRPYHQKVINLSHLSFIILIVGRALAAASGAL